MNATSTNVRNNNIATTQMAVANWTIRQAGISDLHWIAMVTWRILVETGRSGVYRFRDVLNGVQTILSTTARGEYFVAEANGCFAGQLKLVRSWHDLFDKEVATIEHVYVHPDFRSMSDGEGVRVYDRLHQHALAVCRRRDVCQVQLHVVSDNKRAQRAYEKRGMTATGLWMTQSLQ